ncbi:MAG TPA: PQQ-binding-like beta-propeller repeat protein, partial [Ktedonobacteraceae bacterium]
MHQQSSSASFIKNRRTCVALAVVFIVGLLLGAGYFWMMSMKSSQPDQASTPTAFVSGPENVYMARDSHVVKLDGRTGAVLWQHNLASSEVNFPQSPQTCIQIVQGVMYAILDYDSYAFQTGDGKELWHMSMPHTQPSNLSCQLADGRIYVLHTDGAFSALDTKDGRQLWRSAAIETQSLLFQVQHGAIYSERNVGLAPRLTALDGATGKERWHADLQEGNTGFPTQVADGLVYHGTSNSLYALSETTGRIIWQQHTDNVATFFTHPYLVNGVLYVETSANIAVSDAATSTNTLAATDVTPQS